MAKAVQLASGNWNVKASATLNGKKIRRSFTASTAQKAENEAKEWQRRCKMIGNDNTTLTVREAITSYIQVNESRLSPSTVTGYWVIAKSDLPGIMEKPLYTLTTVMIQTSIKEAMEKWTAKTIKNRYGLLETVLKFYYPEFICNIKYPKVKKKVKKHFSEKYIKEIFTALKDTNFEVEAYLGILSMRVSEIAGLKWSDIDFKNKQLFVTRTKIRSPEKKYVIDEHTKTDKSERIIYLPNYVCEILEHRFKNSKSEFVSNVNPGTYWKQLNKILSRNNVDGLGFHELRHIYSSISSRLGIDAQIRMENGGWSSEKIMDGNYRHAMSEAQKEANKKMNLFVNNIAKVPTKIHTKKPKRLKLVRYIHVQ